MVLDDYYAVAAGVYSIVATAVGGGVLAHRWLLGAKAERRAEEVYGRLTADLNRQLAESDARCRAEVADLRSYYRAELAVRDRRIAKLERRLDMEEGGADA